MSAESIRVRRARRSDAPKLLRLIDALADYEKLKRPSRTARARLVRDAFGAGKRFDCFLAVIGREAVGYAIIVETYSSFLALPTLYLEDIFVLSKYRKRKVGWKLFRACIAEATQRGCGRMEWVVLDWNTTAHEFYRRVRARRLHHWVPYRLERKQFKRLLQKI
jgi:GNAT superfamily N-acetyltransferase